MAERITIARIQHLVDILNNETGHLLDFDYEEGYGGIRLIRGKGSIDVSPRLPKAQIYEWIHAYRQGIQLAIDMEEGRL